MGQIYTIQLYIHTKYRQMAFRLPSDGALISPNQPSFGTPGQTKVSGDRQRFRSRIFEVIVIGFSLDRNLLV